MTLRVLGFIYIIGVVGLAFGQTPPPQAPAVIEEIDGNGERTIIVTKSRPTYGNSVGEQLFNDPILSANGEVSCATCHVKDHGFASKGLPPVLGGGTTTRDAPSLWNVRHSKVLMWDGRASTLEEQVLLPITNPVEMGQQSIADVMNKVSKKYPEIDSSTKLAKAIANYERELDTPPNRLDSYLKGQETLTVSEIRGWNLFRGKAECYTCHDSKQYFSDGKFHNTGIGIGTREDGTQYTFDLGRFEVTKDKADTCAYKTPMLRGCRDTAPYMHNGSIKTLEDVVEFYNAGGFQNKALDKNIKPLRLSVQEKADLVAFLRSL